MNGAPNGIWVTAPSQYEADFETYHRAGLTIHTHTNGDEATDMALDCLADALAEVTKAQAELEAANQELERLAGQATNAQVIAVALATTTAPAAASSSMASW